MKVNTITYQKAFVIGPYLQDKVGIEMQVGDDQTPEEVLTNAKGIVESWHRSANPELYAALEKNTSTEIKSDRQPEDIRVAALIADIYRCTEIPASKGGLESFKKIVDKDSKKYPELKSAYNQKHNQLKNKNVVNLP